ncbi:hypothetical protein [Anaerosporobacter sp.]|uniref:hypothetical protein n=1 Tax=Anaerosporobacter sp. TaxID=1872529 RepID=UPI00286F0D50|nr:hypothetical protein [Anaerosporobacter sp.]
MFETLFVYTILLEVGFLSSEAYNRYLDSLFAENPDNVLLLELEWNSFNNQKISEIMLEYCERNIIEYSVLGKSLLKELKRIYFQGEWDIHAFASKVYELWKVLPLKIQEVEPFGVMSYADDPLSWGDEEQTRQLYEEMFDFYKR